MAKIIFGMVAKTKKELDKTEHKIQEKLDGQQMDIFEIFSEYRKKSETDPIEQLKIAHAEAVRKEREQNNELKDIYLKK